MTGNSHLSQSIKREVVRLWDSEISGCGISKVPKGCRQAGVPRACPHLEKGWAPGPFHNVPVPIVHRNLQEGDFFWANHTVSNSAGLG